MPTAPIHVGSRTIRPSIEIRPGRLTEGGSPSRAIAAATSISTLLTCDDSRTTKTLLKLLRQRLQLIGLCFGEFFVRLRLDLIDERINLVAGGRGVSGGQGSLGRSQLGLQTVCNPLREVETVNHIDQ